MTRDINYIISHLKGHPLFNSWIKIMIVYQNPQYRMYKVAFQDLLYSDLMSVRELFPNVFDFVAIGTPEYVNWAITRFGDFSVEQILSSIETHEELCDLLRKRRIIIGCKDFEAFNSAVKKIMRKIRK